MCECVCFFVCVTVCVCIISMYIFKRLLVSIYYKQFTKKYILKLTRVKVYSSQWTIQLIVNIYFTYPFTRKNLKIHDSVRIVQVNRLIISFTTEVSTAFIPSLYRFLFSFLHVILYPHPHLFTYIYIDTYYLCVYV